MFRTPNNRGSLLLTGIIAAALDLAVEVIRLIRGNKKRKHGKDEP